MSDNDYKHFYNHLDDMRNNPHDWFIHSSYAYDCIVRIAKDFPLSAYQLEIKLKQALNDLNVPLGVIGQDKHGRDIVNDWYGTYFEPNDTSRKFTQHKHFQLRRVSKKLFAKQQKAKQAYKRYDKICKTSKRPTIARYKRTLAERRINDLDNWYMKALKAYNQYRTEYGAEFASLNL